MAKTRITVDPITRIEGHLGIEVEINKGKVTNAWSSGNLFRGFEIMLKGRDPRDAWLLTQRICGVCPVPHGHASTLSLEDSFGVTPPENAVIIRNLIEGAQYLHSHIIHFYQLTALDYVDVVSALSAKPKEPSLKAVQAKLKAFVESGQLGPFANAYWGHPAYKLTPEVNLIAVAHYLEALDMQAKASYLLAIYGGKMPMHMSTVPGGVTCTPTEENINEFIVRLKEIQKWIDTVHIPDILAVAPFYLDWASIGKGVGNYLSWGVFNDPKGDPKKKLLPGGAIYGTKNLKVVDVNPDQVTEFVTRSWYSYDDEKKGIHPKEGVTKPNYTGRDTKKKYTWLKAPRLNDKPMEVGPLARILVAYCSGNEEVKGLVNFVLKELGHPGEVNILFSTLGRLAARAIETKLVADSMEKWINDLRENLKKGDKALFTDYELPKSASGVGLWEAPRGALGHWNQIEDGKLANYQCVVPTTWNGSPRDAKNKRGPIEEALIGTPVADPKKPLEVLRIVHSFDPCIACSVHIIDPETNEIRKFRVC